MQIEAPQRTRLPLPGLRGLCRVSGAAPIAAELLGYSMIQYGIQTVPRLPGQHRSSQRPGLAVKLTPGFFHVLTQSTPPFRQALPLTALADFDDPKYDSEDRAKRNNGLYVHERHLRTVGRAGSLDDVL